MANAQIYADALAKRCVTFEDRCKSGRMAKPAYLPGTTGLKDVRLRPNQKLHIRCASLISLSNGSTDESAACQEYEHRIVNRRVEISRPKHTKVRRPDGRGMML